MNESPPSHCPQERLKIGDFQSQVCVCAASANLICAETLRRNRVKTGMKKAPGRIRTGDLRITNASLYQLSHGSLSQQMLLYLLLIHLARDKLQIFLKILQNFSDAAYCAAERILFYRYFSTSAFSWMHFYEAPLLILCAHRSAGTESQSRFRQSRA